MEMKIFNYMLEIDILRNSSTKKIGCPEGCFLRVWVSKKTPRCPAGLLKTMIRSTGKQQGNGILLLPCPIGYLRLGKGEGGGGSQIFFPAVTVSCIEYLGQPLSTVIKWFVT